MRMFRNPVAIHRGEVAQILRELVDGIGCPPRCWPGRLDVYVLDYLMRSRLRHYRYPCPDAHWWDVLIIPIMICLPLRYERRFFGPRYILRRLVSRRPRSWF